MSRASRLFASLALLSALAVAPGCGWIIGLDEFTDAPPDAGGGGGDGGAPACASPADCPGAGDHGAPTCDQGACGFQCDAGFADCDGELGCETSTAADKQNCGACGVTCGAYCVEGSCNDPVDIVAAQYHACALLKDGTVWCWGANTVGESDADADPVITQPMRLMLPGAALQITAGGRPSQPTGEDYEAHTCAVLEDSTVQCWGNNESGQLALGFSGGQHHPPADVGLTGIRQVAAGGRHTCAVDMSDKMHCWGAGGVGQLGDGTTMSAYSPVEVPGTAAIIAAGQTHTCATDLDGRLRCWGQNSYGQLGINSQDNKFTPTLIGSPQDVDELVCGDNYTCARNGISAYCWGQNDDGQLGLGSAGGMELLPLPIDLSDVGALGARDHHSGALVGGEVYMWGNNTFGQLGTGDAISTAEPEKVELAGIRKLALGQSFSCALSEAASVICWGDGQYGQLGDGTTVARSTPAPVVWP